MEYWVVYEEQSIIVDRTHLRFQRDYLGKSKVFSKNYLTAISQTALGVKATLLPCRLNVLYLFWMSVEVAHAFDIITLPVTFQGMEISF